MNALVYLDGNATAPVRPGVVEAMSEALHLCGNPSSVHARGRKARALVEDVRDRVADWVGADREQVIFTSGGTEANHLAIRGCGRCSIVVSAVEHPSVFGAASLPRLTTTEVSVDDQGWCDPTTLDAVLAQVSRPALVSVMLANNETGVILPVAELAEVARRHNALIHCDAVQAAGKIAVDWKSLGVHFLSLSAHKIGGPQGVGALIVDPTLDPVPRLIGGGQERGLRAGTENVPGIVGFGVAVQAARAGLSDGARLAGLRDRLEARARDQVPTLEILGGGADRLPNTSCLAVPGTEGALLMMALDLDGVMVSAGAACASGKAKRSRTLAAMGVADVLAAAAIRVSLPWNTTDADIDRFLTVWGNLMAKRTATTDKTKRNAA